MTSLKLLGQSYPKYEIAKPCFVRLNLYQYKTSVKLPFFNYTRYLFGETAKRVFLVALACAIIGMTSHLVNEKIYRSLTEKYGLMSDRYVLAKIEVQK